MTVAELLDRCPAAELTEWMAYEQIAGPLGGRRGDYQAANVAATVYGMLRGKKGKRPKLVDFLIEWDRRARSAVGDDEIEAMARGLAARGRGRLSEPEVRSDGDD